MTFDGQDQSHNLEQGQKLATRIKYEGGLVRDQSPEHVQLGQEEETIQVIVIYHTLMKTKH